MGENGLHLWNQFKKLTLNKLPKIVIQTFGTLTIVGLSYCYHLSLSFRYDLYKIRINITIAAVTVVPGALLSLLPPLSMLLLLLVLSLFPSPLSRLDYHPYYYYHCCCCFHKFCSYHDKCIVCFHYYLYYRCRVADYVIITIIPIVIMIAITILTIHSA